MKREELHSTFGAIAIGLFLGSLITSSMTVAIIGVVSLLGCGLFGSRTEVSEEGKRILRKYCIPLTISSLVLWAVYMAFLPQPFSLVPGSLALICLCLVQFWSGPKVIEKGAAHERDKT